MGVWMRRVVSAAVLAVLAGGPALAVVCAAACEPTTQATLVRAAAAHHQPDASECHDLKASNLPRIGSAPGSDCDAHHPAGVDAVSLAASRADAAAMQLDVAPDGFGISAFAPQISRAPSASQASIAPPRPTPASLVLRI